MNGQKFIFVDFRVSLDHCTEQLSIHPEMKGTSQLPGGRPKQLPPYQALF
jgi:hypothetical protein